MVGLEPELLEEPFVLSALVSVLELQSDGMTCLFALNWILQIFWWIFLIQSHVWYTVTCWHHMVVVDHLWGMTRFYLWNFIQLWVNKTHLDERLYLGFLMDLGLIHSAGDTFWIAIDASYQGMSELLVWSSIVECLQNNGFPARIPSRQYKDHLSVFHNLTHCGSEREEHKNINILSTNLLEKGANGCKCDNQIVLGEACKIFFPFYTHILQFPD